MAARVVARSHTRGIRTFSTAGCCSRGAHGSSRIFHHRRMLPEWTAAFHVAGEQFSLVALKQFSG